MTNYEGRIVAVPTQAYWNLPRLYGDTRHKPYILWADDRAGIQQQFTNRR